MDKEQLMKPRYKVIADYPGNVFEVGSILIFLKDIKEGTIKIWAYNDRTVTFSSFDKYPHLFKPLQWWEHREDGEMPEYVKTPGEDILKLTRDQEYFYLNGRIISHKGLSQCVPATEQEYNEYIAITNHNDTNNRAGQ